MTPRMFIVTGMSGAGKTTIARRLLERGEIAFDSKINSDLYQFIDENGRVAPSVQLQDKTWRAQYKWSLNKEKLNELLKLHRDASRVFLCGRANLFQYWNNADAVFLLRVDASTLHERLNNASRDNLFAKDSATQRKLLHDLDTVQDKIIQKGAVSIDAKLPVDTVIDQILKHLKP